MGAVRSDGSPIMGFDGLVVDGCCTAYVADNVHGEIHKVATTDGWTTAAVVKSSKSQCQQPTTGDCMGGDYYATCIEGFGAGPYYIEKFPGFCAASADTSFTCGDVKNAYKNSGCCGNPSSTMTMPA